MKNPFGFADELESEENLVVKKTTQATQSAGDAAVKQAKQQAQDTNKAIVEQLYAPSSGDQGDAGIEALAQGQKNPMQQKGQTPQKTNDPNASAKSPQEEMNLARIRKELFNKNYGGQFSLEQQSERLRKQREQEEQQKKQIAEQEEQQKKQELEEKRKVEVLQPPSKGRSRMGPSFTATDKSKKKTEMFPGAAG